MRTFTAISLVASLLYGCAENLPRTYTTPSKAAGEVALPETQDTVETPKSVDDVLDVSDNKGPLNENLSFPDGAVIVNKNKCTYWKKIDGSSLDKYDRSGRRIERITLTEGDDVEKEIIRLINNNEATYYPEGLAVIPPCNPPAKR